MAESLINALTNITLENQKSKDIYSNKITRTRYGRVSKPPVRYASATTREELQDDKDPIGYYDESDLESNITDDDDRYSIRSEDEESYIESISDEDDDDSVILKDSEEDMSSSDYEPDSESSGSESSDDDSDTEDENEILNDDNLQ